MKKSKKKKPIKLVLVIDGKELAKAVAPYMLGDLLDGAAAGVVKQGS